MRLLLPALIAALLPAAASAQPNPNTYAYPPGYRPPTPPSGMTAPSFTPCINYPYLAAVMGPCQGPIGQTIRVQMRRNMNAQPMILSFKAVVSRGVPARLQVRLQRLGNDWGALAPQQLCIQGGGSWEAELVLTNGQNVGVIGGYTPTNCPR